MAIIECPRCGEEIWDQAKACPKCGLSVIEIIARYQLDFNLKKGMME